MEKKLLIKDKLCGIYNKPANIGSDKIPLVLLMHGFGSNKDEVNNTFKLLAHRLAEKNIASLRFDFAGFGESAGFESQTTINSLLSDAKLVFQYILQLKNVDYNRIGFCGFSLGAAICILLNKEYSESCKSMALLSPAGNLPNDFLIYLGQSNYAKLQNSISEQPIEIDLGWRKIQLKKDFINSLSTVNLKNDISSYKGPLLIAAGTDDFSYIHLNEYMTCVSSKLKKAVPIAAADHIFNSMDKEKSQLGNVIDITVSWFNETL